MRRAHPIIALAANSKPVRQRCSRRWPWPDSLLGLLLSLLLISASALPANELIPPPEAPATAYAAVEVHASEGLAIAAEPCESREKQSIFAADYLAHGILPIRLIITNSSSHAVSLAEAEILFLPAHGEPIQAATAEEVITQLGIGGKLGHSLPMPGPLPSIHWKAKSSAAKAVRADFERYVFRSLRVEPHTTVSGFLFYDLSQLKEPLPGARLELRRLLAADGHELFGFEIPFDSYLHSKSKTMN